MTVIENCEAKLLAIDVAKKEFAQAVIDATHAGFTTYKIARALNVSQYLIQKQMIAEYDRAHEEHMMRVAAWGIPE